MASLDKILLYVFILLLIAYFASNQNSPSLFSSSSSSSFSSTLSSVLPTDTRNPSWETSQDKKNSPWVWLEPRNQPQRKNFAAEPTLEKEEQEEAVAEENQVFASQLNGYSEVPLNQRSQMMANYRHYRLQQLEQGGQTLYVYVLVDE